MISRQNIPSPLLKEGSINFCFSLKERNVVSTGVSQDNFAVNPVQKRRYNPRSDRFGCEIGRQSRQFLYQNAFVIPGRFGRNHHASHKVSRPVPVYMGYLRAHKNKTLWQPLLS